MRSRWLWLLLLLVGLGWLLPAPGPSAAQQTVTLDAYLSAITHYRSQVRSAANNSAQCPETLTAVANALNAITSVQFPDGSVMRVNHQGVTQALQSRPCNLVRADQYLSGLCPNQLCAVTNPLPPLRTAPDNQNNDSLAEAAGATNSDSPAASNSPPPTMPPAMTPPPNAPTVETNLPADQNAPGDNAETPAATAPPAIEPPAEAVPNEGTADGQEAASGDQTGLATKESAGATGEPTEGAGGEQTGESPTEPGDQAGVGPGAEGTGETTTPQATPTAASTPPTPTAVSNPPAATATPDTPKSAATPNRWLLLIVVVAALALIGTAVALLFWPGKEEEESEEEKEQTKVTTAVREGRQLREKGDYREAARQLFLAMLLALDEKGILRFDRNRTNRELLQQERLHKELVPSLMPIIATYERVWYGLEPLPAAEYERLVNEIKAIRDWQVGM
ncbi:MAG: DUF4129 domain-containing protein [Anaerolineae bacterium]|nr:DUF4129 domain-containing protein [Anaerolineae bacterium]